MDMEYTKLLRKITRLFRLVTCKFPENDSELLDTTMLYSNICKIGEQIILFMSADSSSEMHLYSQILVSVLSPVRLRH